MPGNRRAAEAGLEALEERLGQGDFWKQDESLPVLAQGFGNGFEIDFCLARSRHPIEQNRVEALSDRRGEARRRLGLLAFEVRWRKVRVGAVERTVGID